MSHFYERGRYLKSRKTQVKMSDARIKKKSRRKGFLGDAQTFTKSKAGKYICIYSWWTLKLFFWTGNAYILGFSSNHTLSILASLSISLFQTLERVTCARQKLAVKFHFGYLFWRSIISNFEILFYLCGICFVQKEPILQFITV